MAKQKRLTKTQALRLAREDPQLGPVLERGGKVVLVEPERGRGRGDRAVVGADDRAEAFLRRRRMNPLTRLYFPPGDTSGHRHAIVFLRPTSSERRYVVVDLTDAQVVGVLDEDDLTRNEGA